MLPPFIIEQIRRLEEDRRRNERTQPRLELPVDVHRPRPRKEPEEEAEDRGVAILDIV